MVLNIAGRILPCAPGPEILQRRLHVGPQDHHTTWPVQTKVASPEQDAHQLTGPCRYLVAKLFSPIFGCSTKVLRIQNAFALSLIFFIVVEIRRCVRAQADPQRVKEDDPTSTGEENIDTGVVSQTPTLDALTAFNIALFPPLSLFGALYYTDVMSTAAVLLSYHAFLLTTKKSARTIFDDVIAVLTGVVALFFRQTNIFWVAVFPAGATVIQALKRNGLTSDSAANEGYVAILQESWSRGTIYDRPLQGRGFDFSGMSTAQKYGLADMA